MNLLQRLAMAWKLIARGQKALADVRPETLERVHLASLRSDAVEQLNAYSYLGAVADYGSYVWVRKAVRIIADNFAALPVRVERGGQKIEHWFGDLLRSVNNAMSSADLWQQWAVDMLLGGEEFWEMVPDGRGRYVEIWPRQPHTVGVVPDRARARYREVALYRIDDGVAEAYDLPPAESVHYKFFNPANPWRGISPVSAVRAGIVIDQLSQAWSQSFLRNGARPDYAIVAPEGTTITEREQILAKLRAAHSGPEHAHEPIVLEAGITDIKMLSFPPKDMEWLEQRKFSRTEIAAIFGVPEEIMGFGRDTYENFDTAQRVMWAMTIRPLAALRDAHLTEWAQRYGVLRDDEAVATDYSGVSVLKDDYMAKLDQAKRLFDMGVPFNRVDELLGLGVGRVAGGDVGYLPMGLAPATMLGLGIEPGAETGSETMGRSVARKAREPVFGSEEHRAQWDSFVKRVSPHERRLGRVVAELFREQRDEVLAALSSERAKSADSVAREPFDREVWRRKFRQRVGPVLRDTVAGAGQAALSDLGLEIDFDLQDPNVIRFLEEREQRFAHRVTDTTWKALRDSLSAGIAAGETIPELAARVEAVMADRIRSSGTVIARTEVTGASNGGTLLSWKQSGVVKGKQWLSALDERVRPSHVEAHGQMVALDGLFEVGAGAGPTPGQIGLAEEDIQCRCTMTAVLV